MNVELRHLRSFLVLAGELNFTRAAARLHLAQQALSSQIQQLEQELGVTLFSRSTRKVELTAAGQVLLKKAPAALNQIDSVLAEIRDDPEGYGSLTLGLLATSLLEFTPRLLRAFATERPNASLSIRNIPFSDPSGGVLGGQCDVALVWLPFTLGNLACEPLFFDERVAVIASDHPLASLASIPAPVFAQEPFVWVDDMDPLARDFWTLADQRQGQPARQGAKIAGFEDLFTAVRAGQAVAASPRSIAGGLPWPDLTTRPIEGLTPAVVAICWRPQDSNHLAESLIRCARSLAEDLDCSVISDPYPTHTRHP